jgi:hypothetical protein
MRDTILKNMGNIFNMGYSIQIDFIQIKHLPNLQISLVLNSTFWGSYSSYHPVLGMSQAWVRA